MEERNNIYQDDDYINQVMTHVNELKPILDELSGEVLLSTIYMSIEKIQKDLEIDELVECGRTSGCNFCCHDKIETSITESEFILEKVRQDPSLVDIKSAFYHTVKPYEAMSFAQRKCSFLNNEGRCSIYEHRPIICRIHNVKKGVNKELCKRLTGAFTDELKSSILDAFIFYLTQREMTLINLNRFIGTKISSL